MNKPFCKECQEECESVMRPVLIDLEYQSYGVNKTYRDFECCDKCGEVLSKITLPSQDLD